MGRELKRKEMKKNKGSLRNEPSLSSSSEFKLSTFFKIIIGIAIILFIVYYFVAVFITKEVDVSKKNDDSSTNESSRSSVSGKILAQRVFEQAEDEYYVYFYDFTQEDKNISSAISGKSDMTIYRVDTSSALNQKYVTTDSGNSKVSGIDTLKVKNPTLMKISGDKVEVYLEGVDSIVDYLNQ